MEDPEKEKEEMTSLMDVMKKLQNHGFKENFTVKDKKLHASGGQAFEPRDVTVLNFYRFEGESDPADSSILYAIETHNGVRGLLSDAYGPYADSQVTEFFDEIEQIKKRIREKEPAEEEEEEE